MNSMQTNKLIKFLFQRRLSGQVLIVAFILIVFFLIVVTSFVVLSVSELKRGRTITDSLAAYYAAEAGVEKAILQIKNGGVASDEVSGDLDSSTYKYKIETTAPGVPPGRQEIYKTITSTGEKNNVRRRLVVEVKSATVTYDWDEGASDWVPVTATPSVYWPKSWVETNPYE